MLKFATLSSLDSTKLHRLAHPLNPPLMSTIITLGIRRSLSASNDKLRLQVDEMVNLSLVTLACQASLETPFFVQASLLVISSFYCLALKLS